MDTKTVQHIAHLARLHLSENETTLMLKKLDEVMAIIDPMCQVDTTNIMPLYHPLDIVHEVKQRLREDDVTKHNQREQFQPLTPHTASGFYLVPKVIE